MIKRIKLSFILILIAFGCLLVSGCFFTPQYGNGNNIQDNGNNNDNNQNDDQDDDNQDDDNQNDGNQDDDQDGDNQDDDQKDPVLLEFKGITFKDENVIYDGEEHTILVKGAPDFAEVTYTNAGPFVSPGEYEITAKITAEGYKDLELKATLFIFDDEDEIANGLTFEEYNRYVVNKPYTELPYTVEMEIKLGKNVSGAAGSLFSNLDWTIYGGASVGVGRLFHIDILDGVVRFQYTNKYHTREEISFDGVDVRTGTWTHLAITFDNANKQVILYVNGVYKVSKSIKADLSDLIKETKFHIGGDNRTLNPNWFKGEIREVVLFDDPRSAEEVLRDFQTGVPSNLTNLIAQYRISSDQKHTDLADISANDYWARYEDTWYDEQEIEIDYSHSFAVVGDTQMLNYWGMSKDGTNTNDATTITNNMNNLYKWILNNQESQKIQHVFGLGDITETWAKKEGSAQLAEWQRAKDAMYQMNGKLSYSIVRGNHDESIYMNRYFGEQDTLYRDQITSSGGFFDSSINTFYKEMTVGSVQYLFIGLDYGASDSELEWANQIVAARPNHKVIVTTHGYLEQEGNRMGADYPHSPHDNSDVDNDTNYNHGEGIWDKFISNHANIFLVMSGHISDEDITTTQMYGKHGNLVTQMLIDFQDVDKQLVSAEKQASAGIVTMLYFSEDGTKMEVAAYSTVRDKFYKKYNHFIVDLNGPCDEGHSLTHHNAVSATCVEDGNVEYNSCSRCGLNFDNNSNVLSNVVVSATGHNYDGGTSSSEEEVTYTCLTCGDTKIESLNCTITVNHLYLDGTVASPQEVLNVKQDDIKTINAKTISGYVASLDYIKVHALEDKQTVNIYYSKVSAWDGKSVSTSLKGSGTLTDPYLISSGADLAYIASVINAHSEYTINHNSKYTMYIVYSDKIFKLTNSIDLGGHPLTIGYYLTWSNYSVFNGLLDGNNCSIRGMNVSSSTIGSGLFAGIGPHSLVKNISVYGTVSSTVGTVAGLTGWLGGSIENCVNYANVSGTTDCGGLVGNAETGSIILDCTNYGNINSTAERVGGVAGTGKSVLTNCVNFGNVKSTSSNVGGVIGAGTSQDITSTQSNLRNYGTVIGTNTTGGIIGLSFNTLENCVNYGEVKASSWNIGGIVGRVSNTSTVSNCVNNGAISSTADCTGGLVGTNQGKLMSSVNNGSVTATTKVGGIVFNNQGTIIECVNKGKVTGTNTNSSIDGICQSNNGTITDCRDDYEG